MAGMSSDNYFVVTGFMCNEMGLSGNELMIYAIIRGFTQDGYSRFTGGRGYLAKTLNISMPTVDKALASLVEKQYIIKVDASRNDASFYEYYANLAIEQELEGEQRTFAPSKETLHPQPKNLATPSKETLHNNINNNIENNKTYKKERKKQQQGYDDILDAVPLISETPELKDAFIEFIKMRKMTKKPLTDRALKMIINKTYELGKADAGQMIKILNQSIEHCWQTVYDIKDNPSNRTFRTTDEILHHTYNPFTELKRQEGIS